MMSLGKHVNLKPKLINIDNTVFKMHYRITCWMLLLFTSILCVEEYNKRKIQCTHSDPTDSRKQLEHVIDTFCFFMATFTVSDLHNATRINHIAASGVGPHTEADDIIRHKYYQWVPYVLFLQGIAFYIPHFIWRSNEGGRLKALVEGFSLINIYKSNNRTSMQTNVAMVEDSFKFKDRIKIYKTWLMWLIFCEVLNFVNLIIQIYLTNWFLGGEFLGLGNYVYENWVGEHNPLDRIFPKTAKCNFQKFGPTGTVQIHDVICVLSLNIINEKIYLVLWYWYIILGVVSGLMLIHRLLSMVIYSTQIKYNVSIFNWEMTHKADQKDLLVIMQNLTYSEWFFLQSLCTNMDGKLGVQLLHTMAGSYFKQHRYSEEEVPLKRRDEKLAYEHQPTQVVSFDDVKQAMKDVNQPQYSKEGEPFMRIFEKEE